MTAPHPFKKSISPIYNDMKVMSWCDIWFDNAKLSSIYRFELAQLAHVIANECIHFLRNGRVGWCIQIRGIAEHLIVLLLGLLITPMLSPVNDCTSLADVAFLQDA